MKLLKILSILFLFNLSSLVGMESGIKSEQPSAVELPSLTAEQTRLALDILIHRAATMDENFARACENQFLAKNILCHWRVPLENFEDQADEQVKAFFNILDARQLAINECSYPHLKALDTWSNDYGMPYLASRENFCEIGKQFCLEGNKFKKRYSHFYSLFDQPVKASEKLLRCLAKQPAEEDHKYMQEFKLLFDLLVQSSESLKEKMEADKLTDQLLIFYFELLALKSSVNMLIHKATAFFEDPELAKTTMNYNSFFFSDYLHAHTIAQLNQNVYKQLLLSLPAEEQKTYQDVMLYPAHYAQTDEELRNSLSAIVHDMVERTTKTILKVDALNMCQSLLSDFAYFRLQQLRLGTLKDDVLKLSLKSKQTGLSEKDTQDLAAKKVAYKNLLELNQKEAEAFKAHVVNAFANTYHLEINYLSEIIPPQEYIVLRNLFTSIFPNGVSKSFVHQLNDITKPLREIELLLCPEFLLPYWIVLDACLSDDTAVISAESFRLNKVQERELKSLAYEEIKTFEHAKQEKTSNKSQKRKAQKAALKKQIRTSSQKNSKASEHIATPEPTEVAAGQEKEKVRELKPKKIPAATQRQPSRKNRVTLDLNAFMRFWERKNNNFIPCVSVEIETPEVVILRQWRGYNTDEQMYLFLYPEGLDAGRNRHDYYIDINEEKLPKMVDSLEADWDTYHAFTTEIESKFLTSCAFTVEPMSKFAQDHHIRLSNNQYALCIRAKILRSHNRYDKDYAVRNKNDHTIGTDGHIVYIVNKNTHECVHRFFHAL